MNDDADDTGEARKGVTVLGPPNLSSVIAFPEATAFERHTDGSLSIFEDKLVIGIFEPGFGGAFMTDSLPASE